MTNNENKFFTDDGILRIPIQFFAEGGDGNADGNTDNGGNADNQADNTSSDNSSNKSNTAELDRLVQQRADKITADLGKKLANANKELEKLRQEKMTAEEIKQLEISRMEEELKEREKMLLDKENRLLAIKAIKAAGLDDSGDNALELVDFVIADNEDAIKNKVKAFGDLVKKFVKTEVEKMYADAGSNPKGSSGNTAAGNGVNKNSIAAQLGTARAERQKQSRDIINFYSKGGKS